MRIVISTPRTVLRNVALAAFLAAAVAGCGTMSETNVHGIVVTESMVASVKPGTPQAQVIDTIGTPSTWSTINGEAAYYISQTTSRPVAFMRAREVDRTVFVVYFNGGKVSRVAHYGLQDGVVFDYIARKTPTAGADMGFVTQLIQGLGRGIPGLSR